MLQKKLKIRYRLAKVQVKCKHPEKKTAFTRCDMDNIIEEKNAFAYPFPFKKRCPLIAGHQLKSNC